MLRNVNNYIMLAIIFFALYLTGYFAYAQSYVEKQNDAHINLLENAGFESNLAKWSKVGSLGTFTTTSSTATLLQGKYSAHLTFGSSTQSAAACSNYYDPQSLKNSNGEMGFSYRFSSVDPASGTVFVEDASGTVLSKMDLDITLLGEKRDASKLFAFNDKPARLCMLGKGTTAVPWGIILDNAWMGSPRSVVKGPVITDWEDYTPTFTSFGSVTNINFAYKQVGGSIFIRGYFTAGTVAVAVASISLPKSFVAQATGGIILAGSVEGSFNHGTQINAIYSNNDTALYFSCSDGTAHGLAKQNASLCFASNKNVSFTIGPIKIQGLSGTATAFTGMCKDAYECENVFTSAILASGAVSSSTVAGWVSSGAPSSAVFPLTFKAGLFSAPPICHCTNNGGVSSGDNECNIFNITATGASAHTSVANAASAQNFSITCTRSTDYVQKKVIQGYLSEQNLLVSYYASANKSTSPTQPIDFDTKLIDATNCNCVTTGASWKFTAPRAGYYEISVNHILETTGGAYYFIYKNGTNYAAIAYSQNAATAFGVGERSIYLAAGDYIDVRPDTSRTITGGSITTSGPRAFIEVKWRGN